MVYGWRWRTWRRRLWGSSILLERVFQEANVRADHRPPNPGSSSIWCSEGTKNAKILRFSAGTYLRSRGDPSPLLLELKTIDPFQFFLPRNQPKTVGHPSQPRFYFGLVWTQYPQIHDMAIIPRIRELGILSRSLMSIFFSQQLDIVILVGMVPRYLQHSSCIWQDLGLGDLLNKYWHNILCYKQDP